MRRKILVVTSTRAEYGLLKNVIRDIHNHKNLSLCLVVTGTHLSVVHGSTVSEIISDGFPIHYQIPILDSGNDVSATVASMGRLQIGLDEVLGKENPSMMVVLGDRYEIFAAASIGVLHNVPIAHIHGGELTLGAVDDAFRHSITKMSWLHFTSTEEYRKRVIHLGEDPARVFNTGAPAVDSINESNCTKEELETFLGIKLRRPIVLGTFHPETMSPGKMEKNLVQLWKVLKEANPGSVIFTKANADAGGTEVNNVLENLYKEKDAPNGALVSSLGHRLYLGLLRLADVAVGNSSSLIIEAPMVGTPSINVGDRQKGRIRTRSVIDVPFEPEKFKSALQTALTLSFQEEVKKRPHPYGTPGVAKRIVNCLAETKLPENLMKVFYE